MVGRAPAPKQCTSRFCGGLPTRRTFLDACAACLGTDCGGGWLGLVIQQCGSAGPLAQLVARPGLVDRPRRDHAPPHCGSGTGLGFRCGSADTTHLGRCTGLGRILGMNPQLPPEPASHSGTDVPNPDTTSVTAGPVAKTE